MAALVVADVVMAVVFLGSSQVFHRHACLVLANFDEMMAASIR